MFNITTFPGIGIKNNREGDAVIYYDNIPNTWILEHSKEFWMGLNTFNNYQLKQFYGAYDLAHGNVLCTGLGFGLLPVWLTNKDSVNSITVVEKSKEVIKFFKEANPPHPKLNIIEADATEYRTNEYFDCIFLDHYETQSYNKTVVDALAISDNVPNHKLMWLWALEAFYIEQCYVDKKVGTRVFQDFSEQYESFRNSLMKGIKLPDLTPQKINEYIYTYHNVTQWGGIVKESQDVDYSSLW